MLLCKIVTILYSQFVARNDRAPMAHAVDTINALQSAAIRKHGSEVL